MGWNDGHYRSRKDSRNYDEKYAKFRKEVRKRDKNHCQMPGCQARKALEVHHILRWADCPHLRYEIRNGISLCKSCHDSIKNCEELYIELFTKIVERLMHDSNKR